eukprot:CAMPEP_0201507112 /NCGR_PEP_ID=MMETSP0161_2-20130828/882_1 /ASSEMBLY_ACC=CAM_ASM_000251 /TAXON_ID=180227 /ORGANISM="Neoparamoeba aestuarina, Strain SoJaBio B1-5/56/2" /LENGTH=497 /DNA_ID=CAMNT_0047901395 /DNA_START=121 /DNA_END=1614 /DNA_ORIENTATION=-
MRGLSLCLLVVVVAVVVEGQLHQQNDFQRDALKALFRSADGMNWKNKKNWMDKSVSVCEWYGVTCEGETVTKLHLEDNHLSGADAIPTELGYLSGLKHLHLAGNSRMFGHFPAELGKLKELTYLNTSDCWNLDGSIPAEFGQLQKLEILDFHNGGMEGFVPWDTVAKMTNLKHLDFKGCGFEGPITEAIGSLTQLTYFSVINNHFNYQIPESIGNLVNLKQLWLYGNYFSGPLPVSLGHLTQLEHFDFGNNYIEGEIPQELEKLTNLVRISGYRNRLTGLFPEFICTGDNEWCFEENDFNCPLPSCATESKTKKAGCGSLQCDRDGARSWWDDTDSDTDWDTDSDYDSGNSDSDSDSDSDWWWGSGSASGSGVSRALTVALIVLGCIIGMTLLCFGFLHFAAWLEGEGYYEKVKFTTEKTGVPHYYEQKQQLLLDEEKGLPPPRPTFVAPPQSTITASIQQEKFEGGEREGGVGQGEEDPFLAKANATIVYPKLDQQ